MNGDNPTDPRGEAVFNVFKQFGDDAEPGCMPRIFEQLNPMISAPFIEDTRARLSQVLAYMAETTLQADDNGFREAMTHDAREGLGWLLHVCSEMILLTDAIDRESNRGTKRTVVHIGKGGAS